MTHPEASTAISEHRESEHHETVIIGGGLAGLACATKLAESGQEVLVLEATDRFGGRVRSDQVDGFTLDHGFQVLLTAYPACKALLDYDALRLRAFEPGARIRHQGQFHSLADPWRRPSQLLATALHPTGSWMDKWRIGLLRSTSRRGDLLDLYQRPHTSTMERLRADGFSENMIRQFFQPFLGGVFLDETLSCSSRMMEFVFCMFSLGDIAVPAEGMAAIPRQLAEKLPRGSLRPRNTVTQLQHDQGRYTMKLSDDSVVTADRVVVAVESNAAAALLGNTDIQTEWSSTTNLYYTTQQCDESSRQLLLRGDDSGPIQSAVVLSNVAPEYAPPGQSLVSVSLDANTLDPETGDLDAFEPKIRSQLVRWFGPGAESWRRLAAYRIPFGLPRVDLDPVCQDTTVENLHGQIIPPNSLQLCGDHMETPSIQGALNSGLRAAESILKLDPIAAP